MEFTIVLILFMTLFANSVYTTSAKPNNLSTDGSSLLAIKNQITPDPSNALLHNWTQESSFCNWQGVTCGKRHMRVTSLRLTSMGLGGTIAREIGNLSFLVLLDIGNNTFYGEIPEEMGYLHRLKHLSLQYNLFESQIPPTFGFLGMLRLLDLSNNQLHGAIPPSIFNISSMRVLDLNYNQLGGSLPKDICHGMPMVLNLFVGSNQLSGEIPSLTKCSQATVIALSLNQFTGSVPQEIGNLTQLKELYLGVNNLTGSLPEDIGNAVSLQILNIRQNEITGVLPSSLGNLSNLEMLDMGNNNLHGQIPLQFGQLSNLQELYFSFDNLNGEIPTSIFNISNLRALVGTGNNLSGTLPSDIALRLPNLELLVLSSNSFSGPIPVSISNATKLSTLSLGYNLLTGNVPVTLGNLGELENLILEGNELRNDQSQSELEFLTPMANCMNLKLLQIGYNRLNGILPKSIGNLSSSLEKFHASGSGLRGEIPTEVGNMSNLNWLSLAENSLTGELPSTIGNMRNLQRLRLYGNRIQGGIPTSFCNLRTLFEADLNTNKLRGEIPGCIGNISSLRQLYLDSNELSSSLPSTFWNNKGILIVNLSSNFLNGSLSPEIGTVAGLQELYLSGNNVQGQIPISFGNLQNLVNLSLSSNMLEGQIPESFGNLVSLGYLDLSNNNISGIIPKSLEKLLHLSYLNLSFNALSGEIPDGGPFQNFTSQSLIGNQGLCGPPRFHVMACKSSVDSRMRSRTKVLLKYVLPSCAVIILVVVVLVVILLRNRYPENKVKIEKDLELTKRITYLEILRATRNFDSSNMIGRGSSGSVYKATFSNGMVAAVKRFNSDILQTLKSFDTECEVMRNTRHRNLVKVITTCSNIDLKAIVMEFMPKESLENWLYCRDSFLDIVQRLKVMIDIASALEYLHHGNAVPIVHCDIKPNNVLFDDDMVAHLGDFGIAKLLGENISAVQTKTLGTMGYMAPEYGSEGIVSTKVDVYSYGVLMIEVVTRRKPTDECFSGSFTIKRWISESLVQDRIWEIVDANLLGIMNEDNLPGTRSCLIQILKLAEECIEDLHENRVNMSTVLARLLRINAEFLHCNTVIIESHTRTGM